MKIVVGTDAVLLPVVEPSATVFIQNLGAGIVYVDGNPGVTAATGVKIVSGASLIIPGPDSIGQPYLISDTAATDVRYFA